MMYGEDRPNQHADGGQIRRVGCTPERKAAEEEAPTSIICVRDVKYSSIY